MILLFFRTGKENNDNPEKAKCLQKRMDGAPLKTRVSITSYLIYGTISKYIYSIHLRSPLIKTATLNILFMNSKKKLLTERRKKVHRQI